MVMSKAMVQLRRILVGNEYQKQTTETGGLLGKSVANKVIACLELTCCVCGVPFVLAGLIQSIGSLAEGFFWPLQ